MMVLRAQWRALEKEGLVRLRPAVWREGKAGRQAGQGWVTIVVVKGEAGRAGRPGRAM